MMTHFGGWPRDHYFQQRTAECMLMLLVVDYHQ